ncbi:MAG: ATP-dependent DNA helicase PcrA [Deltaproteobacteria bacterium]|nr:MAG: ATP-dependent DNA helicase PcrA [Deltaproteobacteria bacterium]
MQKDSSIDRLISALNPNQREAVTHGEGPLLVLAGAGSGKTRVLTHRIAWLVLSGRAEPGEILALTFTNKAAREMSSRVEELLGGSLKGAWVGTFHSIALRILRRHGSLLSVGPDFTVYDALDQKRLAKEVAKELSIDSKKIKTQALLAAVSRMKDDGVKEGDIDPPNDSSSQYARALYKFYLLYQKRLRQAAALDFGDLLVALMELFDANPEIAAVYGRRFKYLLIDEYQDTNRVQYLFARKLAEVWGNITVVGDDDQSIYGWRGANIRNILDFEEAFPGTSVVRLEQNYRSTRHILNAASSVIAKNRGRHIKTLWTERDGGEPVILHPSVSEGEEAAWIGDKIMGLTALGYRLGDIAVLYRTHALSRPIEDELINRGIEYAIFGGLRFYERQEVKDALSFLRLAKNPAEPAAFRRVANVPPRGIGEKTLTSLFDLSDEWGLPLDQTVERAITEGVLAARSARALAAFSSMVKGWGKLLGDGLPYTEVMVQILEQSGYKRSLEGAVRDERAADRLSNLEELLSALESFEKEGGGTLEDFLDRAALLSDQDRHGANWEGVTLLTIHGAKGLEFPCVFIAGLEEEVFPHFLSADTPDGVEEERRLFYVAITRAKERLFLSRAKTRRIFGAQTTVRAPSRFLFELPDELTGPSAPEKNSSYGEVRQRQFSSTGGNILEESSSEESGAAYFVPEPESGEYMPGMGVRHSKYGEGRISAVAGRGPNARVSVEFNSGERKKFIAGLSSLEIKLDG